jgi:hypothetical protein
VGAGPGGGVGAGAGEETGGSDVELIGGLDCDEVVEVEAPPPPHPARITVATTIASQPLATLSRIICLMKTPQSITNASAETC